MCSDCVDVGLNFAAIAGAAGMKCAAAAAATTLWNTMCPTTKCAAPADAAANKQQLDLQF